MKNNIKNWIYVMTTLEEGENEPCIMISKIIGTREDVENEITQSILEGQEIEGYKLEKYEITRNNYIEVRGKAEYSKGSNDNCFVANFVARVESNIEIRDYT